MSSPRKPPIESFGPELFNTLIEGSKRKIEVETTYTIAVKFRLRIHQLRNRMREESHPLYRVAAKTKLSIQWDEIAVNTVRGRRGLKYPSDRRSLVKLIIEPHDNEFSELLKAQGVDVKAPIDSLLITPQEPNVQHDLEDMLMGIHSAEQGDTE